MTETHPPIELEVDWKDELLFETVAKPGRSLVLDGNSKQALSPMEALLGSLCGCMAIDVVMIVRKMREDLTSLKIEARGQRQEEPPRYFRKIELTYRVGGKVAEEKLERAIQLSFEKYCSVFHSLRPDLELEHTIVRQPAVEPVKP